MNHDSWTTTIVFVIGIVVGAAVGFCTGQAAGYRRHIASLETCQQQNPPETKVDPAIRVLEQRFQDLKTGSLADSIRALTEQIRRANDLSERGRILPAEDHEKAKSETLGGYAPHLTPKE